MRACERRCRTTNAPTEVRGYRLRPDDGAWAQGPRADRTAIMTRSSASSMAVFILAVALMPYISAGATIDKVCHSPPRM